MLSGLRSLWSGKSFAGNSHVAKPFARRTATRRPAQRGPEIACEALETRMLLAATPIAPDIDANDRISTAQNLGALLGPRTLAGQSIGNGTDVDLFKFQVAAGQTVRFDVDTLQPELFTGIPYTLDSYLRLFDAAGNELAFDDDTGAPDDLGIVDIIDTDLIILAPDIWPDVIIDGTNSIVVIPTQFPEAFISYTFSRAGTYYIGVSDSLNTAYSILDGTGDIGATFFGDGGYVLNLTTFGSVIDDRFEENDAFSQATDLGTFSNTRTFNNLILADQADWYKFRMTGRGTASDLITLHYPAGLGFLGLELYDARGVLLGRAAGINNIERLTLVDRPAGQYFIRIFSLDGRNNSYRLIINPAGGNDRPLIDDALENNDTRQTATNLGNLSRPRSLYNLRMADSADWFRFRFPRTGSAADFVRIDFLRAQGALGLELYDALGRLIRSSVGELNVSQVSLEGLVAGEYFVRVFGVRGGTNPSYSITVSPPSPLRGRIFGDDRFENNDTFASASDLGTLTSVRAIDNLVSADVDFYKFRITRTGNESNLVRIGFDQSLGDLDLRLFDATGRLLRTSATGVGSEQISLQGLAAGVYVAQVVGRGGATNPKYNLTILPPTTSPPPNLTGRNVLYVNFDGAELTNEDLRRYAGNDWQVAVDDVLDGGPFNRVLGEETGGDGIRVLPFAAGRADRDQILSGIIARLTQDLRPFGVTVRRIFGGGAIEGQGSTTLFFGTNDIAISLTPLGLNIASDIDFSNNNATDIGFISDFGLIVDPLAIDPLSVINAAANVGLHEAGHTFGLYHTVPTQGLNRFPEVMTPGPLSSTAIITGTDLAFLNRAFEEFQDQGGGNGPQNSYRVLQENFGLVPPDVTLTQIPITIGNLRSDMLEHAGLGLSEGGQPACTCCQCLGALVASAATPEGAGVGATGGVLPILTADAPGSTVVTTQTDVGPTLAMGLTDGSDTGLGDGSTAAPVVSTEQLDNLSDWPVIAARPTVPLLLDALFAEADFTLGV